MNRIDSEEDLTAAIERINVLIDLEQLLPEQDKELYQLADLVEAYETIHYPIPDATPAEMLEHLIYDARGVTAFEVAAESGVPIETLQDIMQGKPQPKEVFEKLAEFFHVGVGVFYPANSWAD